MLPGVGSIFSPTTGPSLTRVDSVHTTPRALEGASLTCALKLRINNHVKITPNIVNMSLSYVKNTKLLSLNFCSF